MTKSTNLQDEAVSSLVTRYGNAAAVHGRATELGDPNRANAAHDEVASVYRELRRRGGEAQRALLPLLQDPDLGVRAWAAAAEGEPVLAATADIPGSLVSVSAKMTLRQWREGTLRFP